MQMGSLGFRPPQFSEELAWLPACLQRITDTSVEPKSPSHQQFKEFSCIQGEDSELLWKEESRCSSFRLFLSGEDNSTISSFLSSNGVLHFHLHLSSDGDSQYYQSQLLSTSTAQHGSDKVLQLRHVEISAGRGENTDQIKTKNNAGGVNALPMTSIPRAADIVGPQSSNHVKLSSERSVEKVTVRNLKSTDIKDAVELSIAASEALVIHELVKSESALEAFPTAAVLEAALQVKQARLDSSEDAFDCPTEKSDEIDFLSDLDDLTMADAFEDVGLSFNGFDDQHACGSDVSLVKDTPMSENCFGCENRTENAGHFSLQNKPSNNPTSGLKNSGFPNNSDPMLHKLFLESSHVSETVQRVGFSMVDASIQPQADFNCSDLWNVENAAGESNTSTYIANGFRSRWFGGWTGKEADPVQLKPKIKNIPKCFAAETSFFSESADLAPDENSFVLKCEKNRYEIASDKSVLFEGLSDKVDEGIMASQEVRSSNLSVVDPLCSIVPCSISSESAGATLGQEGKTGEATAGNCFGSSAGLGNESVHVESIRETRQAPPTFGGECSAAKVRRLLTSLKTYSKVLHERDSILGSERLCLNQSTPFHLGDNNNRIRFSDKRNSDMSLAVGSIPECPIGRDIEVNRHTTLVDNPDGETMNDKKNYDEHAKDRADLQHQPSRGRSSPLIVPKRMRQRLQAARVLDCGSLRKAKAEHAVAQDVSVALNSGSSLQWIESVCNNPFDMQVPSRKRVHFSEIEVNLQQNEDLAKRQSLHQKCSASRPSKTFKQIQDSKWFSTMHFRDQTSSMFQGIKFLLTGFSSRKEKEFQGLIWKYGGIVLVDIPTPSNKGKRCSRNKFLQLPIVLCPKKLQTTKFLYACAVNSLILKDKWLSDSIAAGTALSPGKYMVLLNQNQPDARFTRIGKPVCHDNNLYIFDGVGIMLHGKQHFCTKFAKVIQHGGGRVFKTLMWLAQNLDTEKISLAVIVSEEENRASRHLRHCASERNIPMMPSSWIVRSLYSGKLLPFVEKKHTTLHAVMGAEFSVSDTWSQEI